LRSLEDQDQWAHGHTLAYYAMVLYGATRFEEGIEKAREAIRLLEPTGDSYELSVARAHLAYPLWRTGRLSEVVELAKLMYREACETGQSIAIAAATALWVVGAEGDLPEEVISNSLEKGTQDSIIKPMLLRNYARHLVMQGGDLRVALEAILESERICRAQRKENEYTAGSPVVAAHILRLMATRAIIADEREALLRQTHAAVKRASRPARKFPNTLPSLLREQGLLAGLEGKRTEARRLLDRALSVADQQNQRYDGMLTRMARGELGLLLGWPDAEKDLAEAHTACEAMGARFELEQDREADRGRMHRRHEIVIRRAFVGEATAQLIDGDQARLLSIGDEMGEPRFFAVRLLHHRHRRPKGVVAIDVVQPAAGSDAEPDPVAAVGRGRHRVVQRREWDVRAHEFRGARRSARGQHHPVQRPDVQGSAASLENDTADALILPHETDRGRLVPQCHAGIVRRLQQRRRKSVADDQPSAARMRSAISQVT